MRTLSIALISIVIASAAFASDKKDGDNIASASATNINAPVTANVNTALGGAGGKGGNAEATNANIIGINNKAEGGSARIERGAVDVDVTTKNLNENFNLTHSSAKVIDSGNSSSSSSSSSKQRQSQSQSQSVDDSGNSSIVWNERRDVAQAFAGTAAIAGEVCATSVGAGGQGPALGLSLNFARTDAGCEMRKNAVLLKDLGHADAAMALLCQDDDIAAAFESIGKSCIAPKE